MMTAPSNHSLLEEFEAALAWWTEAGVDRDYADDATDWLAAPQATAQDTKTAPTLAVKKDPPQPPPQQIGGERLSWPSGLSAFQHWWSTSDTIDSGGAFPVISPRGNSGADLMVIVTEPEETDTQALLDGPQGQLLAGMIRAAQLGVDSVYTASVLRRHTPMPDWDALSSAGIGDLLLHHIELAIPKRIITFGRTIPPLFAGHTAQSTAILRNLNHKGRSIPLMSVGSLAELLRSAGRRQRFWHNWLEWTDD